MKKYNDILFTKEGFEKIKSEYKKLFEQRPEAVKELSRARELGDLSENGLYKAARATLSSIDNRLNRLKYQMRFSKIIQIRKNSEVVGIGSLVTITDGKTNYTYKIVGEYETDPTKGKISNLSPIGKFLIGKKKGDLIEINAFGKTTRYKILKVENK